MENGFVAVHTGAGNNINDSKYQRVIKDACTKASHLLKIGGSAMDACELAITVLENCHDTNAGCGSNLTWDKEVQCDASIMNGSNLQFGACTNVSTVKNPIELARRICDRQNYLLAYERLPPMLMAGHGAERYAQELGCRMVDAKDMFSKKAVLTYNHYKSKIDERSDNDLQQTQQLHQQQPQQQKSPLYEIHSSEVALDTVGAVCLDSKGNTAAGCSSGGIILKLSGRVGQAATYGAGCWANSMTDNISIATCTTGNGEYLMRTLLAREICMDLSNANCCATALHNTFKTKFVESPYLPRGQLLFGGALTLVYFPESYAGELLWAHTTKSLCIGYMSTIQKTPKFVCSPLPEYRSPGLSSVINGYGFHLPKESSNPTDIVVDMEIH